jgi:hypothetical protein
MVRSKQGSSEVTVDPKVLAKTAEAEAMGVAWAYELQAALRADNRRPAGGWPGTMREASFRVRALTWTWQVSDGESLNEQQRAQIARALYVSAKATWHCHSEREEPDRDVVPQKHCQ